MRHQLGGAARQQGVPGVAGADRGLGTCLPEALDVLVFDVVSGKEKEKKRSIFARELEVEEVERSRVEAGEVEQRPACLNI